MFTAANIKCKCFQILPLKYNMVNLGDEYHNLFSVKPAKHTHQNNKHKINITDRTENLKSIQLIITKKDIYLNVNTLTMTSYFVCIHRSSKHTLEYTQLIFDK